MFANNQVIPPNPNILDSPIEYLKGVGPLKAELLKKELNIFTFGDLLEYYPLRHIDKTVITKIAHINVTTDYVQVAGVLEDFTVLGDKRSKRLLAQLRDKTGTLELCWFQGIHWVEKNIHPHAKYLVFGKAIFF